MTCFDGCVVYVVTLVLDQTADGREIGDQIPFGCTASVPMQHMCVGYGAMDRGVQSSLPSLSSEATLGRHPNNSSSVHTPIDSGGPLYSECERWQGSCEDDRASCSSDTCCSCSESSCLYSDMAEYTQ
ncbi:unnamed protein product, partial [Timema podura]|nr:unnamed protein product [Timema podura]